MTDVAKELNDLQVIIDKLQADNKHLTKRAKKVKGLEATIKSFKANEADYQETLRILDALCMYVERKDDASEMQVAATARTLLSRVGYKTPK